MNAKEFAKKVYEANKNYIESGFGEKEKDNFFSLRSEYTRKYTRRERKQAEQQLGFNPCGPIVY
jgi:hypothetical protein